MIESEARAMAPVWSKAEAPQFSNYRHKVMRKMTEKKETFIRDHMITILLITAMALEGFIVHAGTAAKVRKETEIACKAQYDAQLQEYKDSVKDQAQAEHWLSGEASKEAFLNQQIDLGAHFIAEESDDTYKCTKLGCAIARVLSPAYPNSLEEVVNQPSQWVRYSADNTITQHDLDLAEKILRPFYEQSIVPNGLSADFVYFNDKTGVVRDTWEYGPSTRTWTYQG